MVLVVGGREARRSGGQRAAAQQDRIGHERRDAEELCHQDEDGIGAFNGAE